MRCLLVTHGELGEALIESARCIYAVDAPLTTLSNHGLALDPLVNEIKTWLGVGGEPALIMVDVGGGSCGVAARAASVNRPQTWVLSGVNLPMVLTYLSSHGQLSSEDLVTKIVDRTLNALGILETDF